MYMAVISLFAADLARTFWRGASLLCATFFLLHLVWCVINYLLVRMKRRRDDRPSRWFSRKK